ncbi:MAG: hypothetical protein GEV08_05815 [Acidimicrobiia bacterium]|nr:hypothetical protein [Acidimicrobiia bacterium]
MELRDRELTWLRAADERAATGDDRLPADLVVAGLTVGSLARRTPAWTEPHVRLLDSLIESHAACWPVGGPNGAAGPIGPAGAAGPACADVERLALETGLGTLVGIRSSLGGDGRWDALLDGVAPGSSSRPAPLPCCPQVVDVDFPSVALRRAEWVGGTLHLRLAPSHPRPDRWTQFRVVVAEPRQWYQTGIDGATTDVTAGAMIVRVPLVAGDLEFTAGSY